MGRISHFVSSKTEEMKTALPVVGLISCLVVVSGGVQQDSRILKNTYKILKDFNPHLKIDQALEKIAQKHRCVMNHSDHESTDDEAQRIYGNIGANLATNPFDRYN